MSVEVVIINWNSRDQTLACLEAVQAQLADGDSIALVDNGSTDGSIAAITRRFPDLRFLPLGTNRGFTGGIAAALERSTADFVIFLNNDALPEAGWLDALSSSMSNAPEDVIAVAGKIVSLDGSTIDFIGGAMTFDGHAFQLGFRKPLGSVAEPAAGAELLFACGGNMIVRRAPFLAIGGFDDDYFAYLEDVDFGWRSWITGHRILYEPKAIVRHHSSATSERLGNFERGVLFERNALQTVLKNADPTTQRELGSLWFLTYLHRLHHFTVSRNRNTGELTRLPFQGSQRAGQKKAALTLDDPLTAMQFRAFDWILRNGERLQQKRAAVQKLRSREDREIFQKFPLLRVATYPGDDALFANPLFTMFQPDLPVQERTLADLIRQ